MTRSTIGRPQTGDPNTAEPGAQVGGGGMSAQAELLAWTTQVPGR